MSWKTAVKVQGERGPTYNGLRFATQQEALDYGSDLQGRWVLVVSYSAEESPDSVNYSFQGGVLKKKEVQHV